MGIPTVIDRIIQQAIQKVKWYAEQGCTSAVLVDLSKYFDTLNHELLMNLLRKNIHDKRVIELIKRYLKAGVMENGMRVKTTAEKPTGTWQRMVMSRGRSQKKVPRKILCKRFSTNSRISHFQCA